VPERYSSTFVYNEGRHTKIAVIHRDGMKALGGIDQLFFDADALAGDAEQLHRFVWHLLVTFGEDWGGAGKLRCRVTINSHLAE